MKLFVRMGLRVKFIGANYSSPQPYTSDLEQLGIVVLSKKYNHDQVLSWLRKNGRNIDYVYLLRPYIAGRYMEAVRKFTKAKVIYNGVDFHYLRELRKYEIDRNPETLAFAEQIKAQEFKIFAKSDVIYTVSEYERSILAAEMPDKRVVVIPTYFYDQPFPLGGNMGFDDRRDITFVGGFSHLPNLDGVLWFVHSIFPIVKKSLPDVKFHIIGSNPPQGILNLKSEDLNVTGFISDDELLSYYSSSRIVVAPIRFGAGVKGKIIEATAHGVPVITTSIGAEGIMNAGEIVIITDSPEQYAAEIIDLYQNGSRWSEIRNRQIQYATQYLSPDFATAMLIQDITNQPVRIAQG
ncbi:glycosyltransferase [Paenibacillus prosopidis]|uniref:glycosyltransferase n=1 Tax=Paenibacillus prosopidis TaxID=630520 RepID=UPI0015F154C7|nr:glycosyltransferase [Paenibacillus prosopidis]